jgi:hypothetical protein
LTYHQKNENNTKNENNIDNNKSNNMKKSRISKNLDTIHENNEFINNASCSISEKQLIMNNTKLKSHASFNDSYNEKMKSYHSTNDKFREVALEGNKSTKIKKAFNLDETASLLEQTLQKLNIKQQNIEQLRKNKDNIIVQVKKQQSNIHKELYLNDNEVLINEKTLQALNKSKILHNIDCIIYDLEMFKINNHKKDVKLIERYCQVSKKYFKYFKSIYSSTVYLDKPLLRLPIANIDKIMISKSNKDAKFKNVEVFVQIYVKFTESNFCN